MTESHTTLAQGCPHHVIPCFTRNVSTDLSSTLHFASHSPHLHLHGSGRSTLCTSPNEELGILADKNPLTGQEADAVSAYTQVEMEDASKYWKFQNRKMSRHLDSDTTTNVPRYVPVWKIQSFLLKGICTVILWQDYSGKGNLRKSCWSTVGRRFPSGNFLFVHREKGLFLSVYVDDRKLAGKKQNIVPMWKVLNKEVDVGEPTSFLDHVHLVCTRRLCKMSKDIVDNCRTMFECRISAGANWNIIMLGSVLNDIVSWQAGRLNNSIMYQSHALMTIISKKNWNPCENCQKYALKLFWNAYTWHVLEDLIFYGQWTNLHDRSKNGPKLVTNGYVVWSPTFIIQVTHKQYGYVANTATQCSLGLCQDSDFTGDHEDSKSTSGGTLCVFWKSLRLFRSVGCVRKQTSVSHSSTESEIISLDAGLKLDGYPRTWFYGIWSSQFLETRIRVIKHEETCVPNQREDRSTPHTNQKRKQSHGMINDFGQWRLFSLKRQFFSPGSFGCLCLKTTKQWSRSLLRNEARQWDMFTEHTELLLIRFSIESIWTPKSKSNALTPKINSQTYWSKGNFRCDEWNHLLCLLIISDFSLTNCLEAMSKRNTRRCKWRQSHSKVEADDEFGLAMQRKDSWRACLYCICKPWENQIWKSFTSELV